MLSRVPRRSKLEMYIDILKVLAQRGPLKLTHIMYNSNVNCSVLKKYLDFLSKQSLIEEQVIPKRKTQKIVYAITERGRTSLNYFKEITIALQTTEELPTPYLYR